MTPSEFQINHGSELEKFLRTPLGKEFFNTINALVPVMPDSFPNEHSMLRSYAKIEGYQTCLRNMIALTMIPKTTVQPEANYGVPDKEPAKK